MQIKTPCIPRQQLLRLWLVFEHHVVMCISEKEYATGALDMAGKQPQASGGEGESAPWGTAMELR
jgi:hypothetical protein